MTAAYSILPTTPSPGWSAELVSLSELRIARSLRVLRRAPCDLPDQPFDWAYTFVSPTAGGDRKARIWR